MHVDLAGLGLEPWLLAFIAAAFLAAGVIKGLTGIGLPTASVGLMSQVLDPRLAIALVVFPSLLSNVWQIWRSGQVLWVIRRFWIYLAFLMSLILLVSMTLTAAIRTDQLMLALGLVVLAFSVISLSFSPPALPDRFDRLAQVVFGVISGVMGGLTAIWAPAMVPYLLTRRLEPDAFVAATGVIIFLGTVPLIAGFWSSGVLNGPVALISLVMVLPAILGFQVGERLRKRLDARRFRLVVLWVFFGMGLNLIRRAVF